MKNKTRGFLLAEAIISILITIFVILILQNLLLSIKTVNHQKSQGNDLAFAYVQLNRFLHEKGTAVYSDLEHSTSRRAFIEKVDISSGRKNKKRYVLEQYRTMLRATTPSSGHMPLLLDVDTASFSTQKNRLEIKIRDKKGRYSKLVFKLDEKKDEKD